MEFLDARRLTGPSLLFDGPAAVLDIACEANEADCIERDWRAHVERMRQALGWGDCAYSRTDLVGGVSLAFTADIDALYAASEINEWAWAMIDAAQNAAEAPRFRVHPRGDTQRGRGGGQPGNAGDAAGGRGTRGNVSVGR